MSVFQWTRVFVFSPLHNTEWNVNKCDSQEKPLIKWLFLQKRLDSVSGFCLSQQQLAECRGHMTQNHRPSTHTHTGGLLPLRAFCKQKCCNGWSQPGRSRSCCTSSTRPVTMETGCYTEAAERAERDGTANRSSSTVHCVVPIHVKSADTLWHHVIRYWKCCCVKCDKTDFAHILKKLHEFKCLSVMIFWKAKHYRNHLLSGFLSFWKWHQLGALLSGC